MIAAPKAGYVLALHPYARGFGWIVLEAPFSPIDWGTAHIRDRKDKNRKCIERIEKLFARYEPETVVLEAFEHARSSRERTARLCRSIAAAAVSRGIDVAVYSHGDVKSCFRGAGARTRQEIAEAVARSIPALAHKTPKARKLWQSASPRMALFCAAALALTQYQRQAAQFFSDLSEISIETDED